MSEDKSISAHTIKNIFERIAPVYDQLNESLSFGQHKIWKQMAVDWSSAQPGDFGLDICCGSGDLALILAKKVGKTGKVIGLDFACQQLAIARQRASKYPLLSLEWVEGDALALPFDDECFDCATMGYGLRNVIDIPACLQELQRVLKVGKKAAILDFHRPQLVYLQMLQTWYLENIVVPTAKDFGLTAEYAYISPSLAKFPQGDVQVKLAYQAGFSQAVHYPIAGGMMGILVVTK
ncbi:MAG: bifunctional demethylmenaquinone methyltransferase/2-methoxy-6-polyprenyl-1,4-benzoquinol methylase UbiE [Cyanobacteria bacterium J083]|nr:MAG: bifunctional demethylmenaquinone methyltransferase/2-methoxy-6-polyprenyl-1,4-benzoquinol methylase UbiE [Cyanobacteria bacterium J083]